MEVWKDIPEYEGIYQASTFGNIRTADGKITSNARYKKRAWKQRNLKFKKSTNKHGRSDYRVELWRNGKKKTLLVARLVALTFVDGYFEGATVNHINGNSLDNSAENLEWVSLSDNIRLAFENGQYHTCKNIRLVDEYGFYKDFVSYAEAGRYIGRSSGYISNVLKQGKKYCKAKDGEFFVLVKKG